MHIYVKVMFKSRRIVIELRSCITSLTLKLAEYFFVFSNYSTSISQSLSYFTRYLLEYLHLCRLIVYLYFE